MIDGIGARLGHPTFCDVPTPIWTDNSSCIAFRYGQMARLIFVGQKQREDASDIIGMLRARGYRILLLSGDHERIAKDIANRLKISEWHGAMSPRKNVIF